MNALYRRLLMLAAVAIAWNLLAMAPAQAASVLNAVSVDAGPDGRVTFGLHFEGPAPEPHSYTLTSPLRLVFDFNTTSARLEQRTYQVGRNGVEALRVIDAATRLRLVVDLQEARRHYVRREGSMLYLQVGGNAPAPASFMDRIVTSASGGNATTPPRSSAQVQAAALPATMASASASASAATSTRVENLDFRPGDNGAGRFVVTLNRANVSPELETHGDNVSVLLPGVRLPAQWRNILDVTDFATPVSRITPHESAEGVRFDLTVHDAAAPLVAQIGNDVTIEVPPLGSPQAMKQQARFPYDGKKITLNFQNIDVRSVLSILAEEGDLNLVVSDNVSGGVTLNLQNVPWDQALDLVLKTRGLASRRSGNVLMVAPSDELAAMAQQVTQADQQLEQSAVLATDYIQVRYAKASDLATLLRGEGGLGLLSERGRVVVDERTNTLLIQDTRERIEQIKQTIDHLDVPVRQVQIEARIVIARSNVTNEMGIRWGVSQRDRVTFDSDTGIGSVVDRNPGGRNKASAGLALDLGSGDSASNSFSFGYLSGDVLLDMELNALESEGKSQTLSQPKVITANQQKALIKQGQEIPYQESTSSGATNVEFKEAVLSLEVTPQITPDNRIIMDLDINNDDVSDTRYGDEPAIDTNEIQTQVLANNGETVVLGGILTTDQMRNLYKTPFLGDLPVLGRLFRYTQETNEKVELLIFITPKIIEDGLSVR